MSWYLSPVTRNEIKGMCKLLAGACGSSVSSRFDCIGWRVLARAVISRITRRLADLAAPGVFATHRNVFTFPGGNAMSIVRWGGLISRAGSSAFAGVKPRGVREGGVAPVRCAPAAVEASIAGRKRLLGGWKSVRSVPPVGND